MFTAVMERNFLTYFLENKRILQWQNGETATKERQWNGGNRALAWNNHRKIGLLRRSQ